MAKENIRAKMGCFTEWLKTVEDSLDNYSVQTRPPNTFGAFISLLIIPATLTYAVILYFQLSGDVSESNNMLWSMSHGPYPMDLQCTAETGCIFSHAEDMNMHHITCHTMQQDERVKLDTFFSGGQVPMMSIYTAKSSSKVASIYSESNYWDADPPTHTNGVFTMPSYMYGASLLANYVVTTNKTLHGVGKTRHEWFFTHINGDGAPETFMGDPCVLLVNETYSAGLADVQHTKIRMAPSFNEIIVEERFNWLDFVGTTSGMYGMFISFGAIALMLIELEVWTKWTKNKVTKILSEGGGTSQPANKEAEMVTRYKPDDELGC